MNTQQQDIERGNKLIASFMELDYNDKTFQVVNYDDEFMGLRQGTLQDLEYHSSWDWLMPVVEKIGKMYDPYKYKAYEHREDAWDIVDLTIMNPINEVWDSVIQFIEWYNSDKNVQECDATKPNSETQLREPKDPPPLKNKPFA